MQVTRLTFKQFILYNIKFSVDTKKIMVYWMNKHKISSCQDVTSSCVWLFVCCENLCHCHSSCWKLIILDLCSDNNFLNFEPEAQFPKTIRLRDWRKGCFLCCPCLLIIYCMLTNNKSWHLIIIGVFVGCSSSLIDYHEPWLSSMDCVRKSEQRLNNSQQVQWLGLDNIYKMLTNIELDSTGH